MNKEKVFEKEIEKIRRRIDRLRSPNGRQAVLHFAHTIQGGLGVNGNLFNQNIMLLPTQNGVIDLRTGEHRPGRQEDLMTKAVPVEWQGIDAPRELWAGTLWEIFEDQEKIDFMQRWLGYCLTGDVSEQKFLCMVGMGRNGKGVIVETALKILGPFAAPIPSEMLLDQGRTKSASAHSTEIADLQGLRFTPAPETNQMARFDGGETKKLSGGDTLVCRRAHAARSMTFPPTNKLLLQTNFEPQASPTDTAFWDRILRVDFPFMFVLEPTEKHHKKRDPYLGQKLKEEFPGILAWMVEGCLLWQVHGLAPPQSIIDSTRQYQESEDDPVQDFIADCCFIPDESEHLFKYSVSSSKLYQEFKTWYENEIGTKVPSRTWFGRRINKRFTRKKDEQGRSVVYGVGLRA